MMPAVVAVTTAECLHNRMPFSPLRFARPLLLGPLFSYQPPDICQLPPNPSRLLQSAFLAIREEVVKVQGGFRKVYGG